MPGEEGADWKLTPDGERAVQVQEKTVRVMDVRSGKELRRWKHGGGAAALFALAPDGRTLAFAARRGWNWQVWTKDVATGAERRITDGNCNNDHPVWEPNSRVIVFASDCGRGFGMHALFRANAGN